MEVKEGANGFYVKNLTMYSVKSVKDMLKVLRKGQKTRAVGATAMNPGSSRSHCILTVIVESSKKGEDGEDHYIQGKLNLVDLAGSERQKKTMAKGDRLDEAKFINLSLSALGNVIKSLVNSKSTHIPFRDSKLTKLLSDSLGGNTKTVMIANIGPSESNLDETMSTLRYANRAKNIKNKPRINEDPKDAMIRKMKEELTNLQKQLNGEAPVTGKGGIKRTEKKVIKKVEVWYVGTAHVHFVSFLRAFSYLLLVNGFRFVLEMFLQNVGKLRHFTSFWKTLFFVFSPFCTHKKERSECGRGRRIKIEGGRCKK